MSMKHSNVRYLVQLLSRIPNQNSQKLTANNSCPVSKVLHPYFSDAMSITKRYFTSLFSNRSYASLIC